MFSRDGIQSRCPAPFRTTWPGLTGFPACGDVSEQTEGETCEPPDHSILPTQGCNKTFRPQQKCLAGAASPHRKSHFSAPGNITGAGPRATWSTHSPVLTYCNAHNAVNLSDIPLTCVEHSVLSRGLNHGPF